MDWVYIHIGHWIGYMDWGTDSGLHLTCVHNVQVAIESDDVSKQFELTMGPSTVPGQLAPPPLGAGNTDSPWERLGLSYTVSWPHHLLFTPPVLEK